MSSFPIAVRLLKAQPSAIYIYRAGQCPACGEYSAVSYQIQGMTGVMLEIEGVMWEQCGYYCENCGWGNAGTRIAKGKIRIMIDINGEYISADSSQDDDSTPGELTRESFNHELHAVDEIMRMEAEIKELALRIKSLSELAEEMHDSLVKTATLSLISDLEQQLEQMEEFVYGHD